MDALLPLLACPVTGVGGFRLEGSAEDGLLVSAAGTAYPVIGGVPRLLPPDLLGPFLRDAFPGVLQRYPVLVDAMAGAEEPEPEVLRTLTEYSHQHVDMADPEAMRDEAYATWRRFQPGVEPADFAGQTVLEVGSGAGRHAQIVGDHAKLLVGLDLSRGVEIAHARDGRPNVFFVQGDLRRPPFRPGAFDALYSNGVIHHTPDPAASFASVARLLRPGGGAYIWVYGLDDMRWSYRLSHLTWLRPMTNKLPRAGKIAVSAGLTAAVEAGLWTPVRVLRRVGLGGVADRAPFADAADQSWTYKLRRMHDRLNPPVTHYITHADLEAWYSGFTGVEILNADGQGWSARGALGG